MQQLFVSQILERSHIHFYEPLKRANEWHLYLKIYLCACSKRGAGGMLQCLFDICCVHFTHKGILAHTQGGNQRANTSALELLVGSKVTNELQFC